jgi:hypothetical protein
MHIIGQPKSLQELQPLTDPELNGFAALVEQTIQFGAPLELPPSALEERPWAMSTGDIGRLTITTLFYRALAVQYGAKLKELGIDPQSTLLKPEEAQKVEEERPRPSRIILPT